MHKQIGEVFDLAKSARSFFEKVKVEAEAALEKVTVIRTAVDIGLLDIDGQRLLGLEVEAGGVKAALVGAEDSLEDADREMAKAAQSDAEAKVATMLQSGKDAEGATSETEQHAALARARIEEARKFTELCASRLGELAIPLLQTR